MSAKYDQAELDKMAKSGEAMPDGSYPIADSDDLDAAIKAVGRGNADHDSIRKHIISRAKALNLSDKIPDNWNSDGSLKMEANSATPATVTRSVPFEVIRADDDGDGLTLSGYAAVFNSPTVIRGEFPPVFEEIIKPGAFKKTISERTPVLQFDHGQNPAIGSIPIGQITTLREDARGLYVEARLFDNALVLPIRQAIAGGAIDGMSFRFQVPKGKDKFTDRSGLPPLREVSEVVCPELGPVVFPAYADTLVGVRAEAVDADETVQPSLVAQVKALIASLLMDEAGELADDPDATGALYALLSVLSDLTWFESIDAVEDQQMVDDAVMEANSTSSEAATRHFVWKPQAVPAEPPPDSTPRITSAEAANRLKLLALRSVA